MTESKLPPLPEQWSIDPRTRLAIQEWASTAIAEQMESLQREIERLKHEVGALTSMGTIECAIRNPAVSESMRHWEGRAESAEREVAALRAMLVDARLDNSRLRGSR